MVDFIENEPDAADITKANEAAIGQAQTAIPTGKRRSEYFAAVRERGMLNAGLDMLAKAYESDHPDEAVRWEFYKPSMDGGADMVVNREAMGFHLVDAGSINLSDNPTPTAQKEGPVRRGDLVMMAGPRDVVNALRLQDAQAAHDDLQAPKQAFEENISKTKAELSDGTVEGPTAFGTIKSKTEIVHKQGERKDLEPA